MHRHFSISDEQRNENSQEAERGLHSLPLKARSNRHRHQRAISRPPSGTRVPRRLAHLVIALGYLSCSGDSIPKVTTTGLLQHVVALSRERVRLHRREHSDRVHC